MDPTISKIRIFLLFVCLVPIIQSCFIPSKENPHIQVFKFDDDSSKSSIDPRIIAVHLPDPRRKRASKDIHGIDNTMQSAFACEKNSDCPVNWRCSLEKKECRIKERSPLIQASRPSASNKHRGFYRVYTI